MPVPEPVDFVYVAAHYGMMPPLPALESCVAYLETLKRVLSEQTSLAERRARLARDVPDTLVADLRAVDALTLTRHELAEVRERAMQTGNAVMFSRKAERKRAGDAACAAHAAHAAQRPARPSSLEERFAASEWLREDMLLFMAASRYRDDADYEHGAAEYEAMGRALNLTY